MIMADDKCFTYIGDKYATAVSAFLLHVSMDACDDVWYFCCVVLPEKRDKKPKKKKPESRKKAKKSKKKNESDDEPMEESDDLDEGEEVDYMSGSSRSPFLFVSWHVWIMYLINKAS